MPLFSLCWSGEMQSPLDSGRSWPFLQAERWRWDIGTCVFSLVRAARWGERSSCFNFIITLKMSQSREFPGVPVVRTQAVTTVGSGSVPGWGSKDPTSHAARRKEKEKIPKIIVVKSHYISVLTPWNSRIFRGPQSPWNIAVFGFTFCFPSSCLQVFLKTSMNVLSWYFSLHHLPPVLGSPFQACSHRVKCFWLLSSFRTLQQIWCFSHPVSLSWRLSYTVV